MSVGVVMTTAGHQPVERRYGLEAGPIEVVANPDDAPLRRTTPLLQAPREGACSVAELPLKAMVTVPNAAKTTVRRGGGLHRLLQVHL